MVQSNTQFHNSMSEKKIFIPESFDESDRNYNDLILREHSNLPVSIEENNVQAPNPKYVSEKHYSSFNFLKLSKTFSITNTAIGITSANKQDGKTMVAVNMAISLARGYQQKTLLVDFNFLNPQLHKIFDIPIGYGIADAMENKNIKVSPTPITNLYLMTAGNCMDLKPGIEHTLVLRQILQTLKDEFVFIVVDMSSILPINEFPVHFINEIDGLISVIDSTRTKKNDFNKIFKHLSSTNKCNTEY